MPPQLIAIDPDALATLTAEVRALRDELSAVRVAPQPKWLTVREYADMVGRSVSTVNRWIADGSIEARFSGKVRLVKS